MRIRLYQRRFDLANLFMVLIFKVNLPVSIRFPYIKVISLEFECNVNYDIFSR